MRLTKFIDTTMNAIRKPLITAALFAAPFVSFGQNAPAKSDPNPDRTTTEIYENAKAPKSNYDPNALLRETENNHRTRKALRERKRQIQRDPYFFAEPNDMIHSVQVHKSKKRDIWLTYYEQGNQFL